MSPIRRIDDLRTHPRASFYLQSKNSFPACEIEDLYILHKGCCLIVWLVVCQHLVDILQPVLQNTWMKNSSAVAFSFAYCFANML